MNTNTGTDERTIKQIIRQELPLLMKKDKTLRRWIVKLANEQAEAKTKELETRTDSKFDIILEELRKDREANEQKWKEYLKADAEKWKEQERKWEAQDRKWEEHRKADAEKWEAQERKWEKSRQDFKEEMEKSRKQFDISPMVEDQAKKVADELGVKIYSFAWDMEEELTD